MQCQWQIRFTGAHRAMPIGLEVPVKCIPVHGRHLQFVFHMLTMLCSSTRHVCAAPRSQSRNPGCCPARRQSRLGQQWRSSKCGRCAAPKLARTRWWRRAGSGAIHQLRRSCFSCTVAMPTASATTWAQTTSVGRLSTPCCPGACR